MEVPVRPVCIILLTSLVVGAAALGYAFLHPAEPTVSPLQPAPVSTPSYKP